MRTKEARNPNYDLHQYTAPSRSHPLLDAVLEMATLGLFYVIGCCIIGFVLWQIMLGWAAS